MYSAFLTYRVCGLESWSLEREMGELFLLGKLFYFHFKSFLKEKYKKDGDYVGFRYIFQKKKNKEKNVQQGV